MAPRKNNPQATVSSSELHLALGLRSPQAALYYREAGLLPEVHGTGRAAHYRIDEVFALLRRNLSEQGRRLTKDLKAFLKARKTLS
jgi:hypothetical protein